MCKMCEREREREREILNSEEKTKSHILQAEISC